jgi:hypothetical protein
MTFIDRTNSSALDVNHFIPHCIFYLDRYGAVDVSGDLDVPRGLPRAHGGRRNPGVEFDSALRQTVNPLLGVWVWTSWTLLPASPSSDTRRLHTLFSPFTHSPFQPLSQSRHRSDLPDQRPKTKSPTSHFLLSLIVSPLSIRVFIIFGGKRRAHDDSDPGRN